MATEKPKPKAAQQIPHWAEPDEIAEPAQSPVGNHESDPAWVAALETELEGYRRYGRTDRAKAVEAELKAMGATVPPPANKK